MEEVARQTVAELAALGVAARFHAAYVNDEEQVDRMAAEVGQVDILVNNAGINRDGHMRKTKKADWDAVLDVNLTGAVLDCNAGLSM